MARIKHILQIKNSAHLQLPICSLPEVPPYQAVLVVPQALDPPVEKKDNGNYTSKTH